jgi:hypothetical protein
MDGAMDLFRGATRQLWENGMIGDPETAESVAEN